MKHHPRQDTLLRGKLRNVAREMRHAPTPADDFLWQRLRNRQLSGLKFHRQYSLDRFMVNFFCPGTALIIEVDGDIHQKQVESDNERDQILTTLGYHVLRFTNTLVIEHTYQVLQQIIEAIG